MSTGRLSRRALLAAVSVPTLAGCAALGDDEDWSFTVEDESFEVTERKCADDDHDATVAFGSDPSRVRVRGRMATPTPCDRLDVSTLTSDDRERPGVLVIVETERSRRTCEPCPATLGYDVTFELNRRPETVDVLHYPAESENLAVTSAEPTAESAATPAAESANASE